MIQPLKNTIHPLKKQAPHVLMINKAFQDTLLRKRRNYRTMYTVYFHFCKRDGVEKIEKFDHKYIKSFWKVHKKLIMFTVLKRDTWRNKFIFSYKVFLKDWWEKFLNLHQVGGKGLKLCAWWWGRRGSTEDETMRTLLSFPFISHTRSIFHYSLRDAACNHSASRDDCFKSMQLSKMDSKCI